MREVNVNGIQGSPNEFGQPGEHINPRHDTKGGRSKQEVNQDASPEEIKSKFTENSEDKCHEEKANHPCGKTREKAPNPKSPPIFIADLKRTPDGVQQKSWSLRISTKALIQHYLASYPIATAFCLALLLASPQFAYILAVYVAFLAAGAAVLRYMAQHHRGRLLRVDHTDKYFDRGIFHLTASRIPLAVIALTLTALLPPEPITLSFATVLSVACVNLCVLADMMTLIEAVVQDLRKDAEACS